MNDEAARQGRPDTTTTRAPDDTSGRGRKPTVADLLATPDALLSRSHLRELGLERRAIDSVIKACPAVSFPGYSRPLIRVSDYLALVEKSTFRGDRVRACSAHRP